MVTDKGRAEVFPSLSAAARYTGLSEPTVRKFIAAGRLRATRSPNGRWRVSKEDLDAFVKWYFGGLREGAKSS